MAHPRRVPRPQFKLIGRPRQISVTLRLPPDVACHQVVAGLVGRGHFRLKEIDGPRARLAVGSPAAVLLGDFGEVAWFVQQKMRLPVGHFGLMWERLEVVAKPAADPSHAVVCLLPAMLSEPGVEIVLADDLERVVADFAGSGHLVSVGSWEAVDQEAAILDAREAKRARKAGRAGA